MLQTCLHTCAPRTSCNCGKGCLIFRYAFAKEIYNKERGKIAEQLSEARSMGLFLKQGLAAVSEMRSSVDERTRAMIKELNEIFTQCMRTINERYSFLYNQIQNIRNERLLHLDAQKSELEYAFGSIQSSIGFTELTLRNSTQVEVLAMKKYIMDRMKELTGAQYNCVPVADDNIRLTVDGNVMQLLSQLGRVEDTNTSPSASLVKGIDAPVVARQMASFLVQCYDGRGDPRTRGGDRVIVTVQSTDDSAAPVKTERSYQAQVIDRQNGCYTVTYTPTTCGEHLITVFINGMIVKGSPFSVPVQENTLLLEPTTPVSLSNSHNDDNTSLGDPLLHFVNSSQAFEVDSARPELKRQGDNPETPTCSKKFKLEPNDLDSLPDQLFAHSPDASRIKQEHLEPHVISEQFCEEPGPHVSKLDSSEAYSLPKQLVDTPSDPEVKLQQANSSITSPPSNSNFLTKQLEDLSSSHDFKAKYSESTFLEEHVIVSSSSENLKIQSPSFPCDGLTATVNAESAVDNSDVGGSTTVSSHFPSDSPTHSVVYNMDTPESEFNNKKEGNLPDERNPDNQTEDERRDSQAFMYENEAVREITSSEDLSKSKELATVSQDPSGDSKEMTHSPKETTPSNDSNMTGGEDFGEEQ